MRGVILAGGTGSRLGPLTRTINKHCLPVGPVPMIYHPLRVLRDNGIDDITIVSSPSGVGQIAAMLGSGHEHGCRFTYRVQDQPGGIPEAVKTCSIDDGKPFVVILGDNVFYPSPRIDRTPLKSGSRAYFTHVDNPSEFGVLAEFEGNRKVVEKPKKPLSNNAVVGLYVFDSMVFWKMRYEDFRQSGRGETEISDVLNSYAMEQKCDFIHFDGFWGDAGTVEGMAECAAACMKGTA